MSITESTQAGGLNSPAATIRFEPHCSRSATLRNCAAGSLNVLFSSKGFRVTCKRGPGSTIKSEPTRPKPMLGCSRGLSLTFRMCTRTLWLAWGHEAACRCSLHNPSRGRILAPGPII